MRILNLSQSVMEAALRVRSMRADVLAENLANADTPNYLARDVHFDAALDQALERGLAGDGAIDRTAAAENLRIDRNNVDLNQQLGKVYENSLNYLTTLRLYSDSMGRLRSATGNS